ncbi:MAG: serine--tRNA ligase, partial [Methyloceanibacter sp.]
MLDIKWIRDNQEAFVKGLEDRGFESSPRELLTQILKLDEQRRETIQKLQEAQARRNAVSKEIGQAKSGGNDAWAETLKEEVAQLKTAIQDGEDRERAVEKSFQDLLAAIPNIPTADVPVGPDAESNVVLREIGTKPDFNFAPKQHFELGEALGLMDFETAAKLSGARFVVLKGALARLERALAQFMLDLHTTEHGYTEVNPPLLVRDDTMFGTAQLPKFEADQFEAKRGVTIEEAATSPVDFEVTDLPGGIKALSQKLWLIPTAEVPLTNLVREEITDEEKLPIRVTAWTPCFRAEAGAAGKDTRGMIRQHQFSK